MLVVVVMEQHFLLCQRAAILVYFFYQKAKIIYCSTYCLVIVFPLCKKFIKIIPLESKKIVAITLLADGAVFAFVGADSFENIHCFDYRLVSGVPIIMDLDFIYGDDMTKKL